MFKTTILAAAAVLTFGLGTASAQQIGVGAGQVGTNAVAGSNSAVLGQQGSSGGAAVLGLTFGTVQSGQAAGSAGQASGVAACNGPACASAAGNQTVTQTQGGTQQAAGALGLAGSTTTGGGLGLANSTAVGAGQTTFTFGSLFVTP